LANLPEDLQPCPLANCRAKVDVIKALDAFKRFFENAQQVKASGFVVSG
jgi:hypothetical protein